METAFAILVLSISTTLQWWRIRVLERRLEGVDRRQTAIVKTIVDGAR